MSVIIYYECYYAIAIEAEPAPFILVCVYRSQSLTPTENLHMIEQIGKLDVGDGYELVIAGDFNLPDVSWDTGVVKCPLATTNKSFTLQQEFLSMFNYKNLSWLLDDSYVTRRRVVNGIMQESLLDQILVSNDNITRNFNIVSPLGKSDHVGILFEIKCSNNIDTVTRSKTNWGKFDVNDIVNLGDAIDWSYSSHDLCVEEMWNELETKLKSISLEAPVSSIKCFADGSVVAKPP